MDLGVYFLNKDFMSKQNTPTHHKLLLASYVLAATASLLSALASIIASSENGKLLYPDINNQTPPGPQPTQNARKYFEL